MLSRPKPHNEPLLLNCSLAEMPCLGDRGWRLASWAASLSRGRTRATKISETREKAFAALVYITLAYIVTQSARRFLPQHRDPTRRLPIQPISLPGPSAQWCNQRQKERWQGRRMDAWITVLTVHRMMLMLAHEESIFGGQRQALTA